jgi:hypothetical protein
VMPIGLRLVVLRSRYWGMALSTLLPTLAFARVETDYSQSPYDAAGIVRIVIALIGGLIAVLGFVVTLRGVKGQADVRLSLGKNRDITFNKISQGVVVIITGVIVLIGSIYFLPSKTREVTTTEDTTTGPDGKTIHHYLKR